MKKAIPITQRAKSSPLKADLALIQGAANLGQSKVGMSAMNQILPVSNPSVGILSPEKDTEEDPNKDPNKDPNNKGGDQDKNGETETETK